MIDPIKDAEQAVKAAKLLVQVHREDIARSTAREKEAFEKLEAAEKVLKIMQEHYK